MKSAKLWGTVLILVSTFSLLGASIFVVFYVNNSVSDNRNKELSKALEEVVLEIRQRLETTTDSLYDLRGLLALKKAGPDDWNNYFRAILEENHPKTYSFAYVEEVRKEDLLAFESIIRRSGDPKYEKYVVYPKTESDSAYPVKFLSTTDSQISVLLGFDYRYSEGSMAVYKEAVRNNTPRLGGVSHLNTVIPNSKKLGYEVILPVYLAPAGELLPEEREAVATGFVMAWIDVESLKTAVKPKPGLKYSLFDGSEKVFVSGILNEDSVKVRVSKEFEMLGRKVRMILESDRPYPLTTFEENLPMVTLVGAVLINLLWILNLYTTTASRKKALALASLATRDLRKFKQAVDGVSDQVIIADSEEKILYANDATSQITGYEMSEIIGNRPSLWGRQMSKEFYADFWKTIRYDKKSFWNEVVNRRKNGELYRAELRVSPILDEFGKLLFFVEIERDLSMFRQIEKMKTEFISLASHQLRTPLSAVKWFSEMLLDGDAGKLSREQKLYVSKIEESNEREISIVNSLLNVSRIESGKIVVVPKPTDIVKLLDSVMNELGVTLEAEKKELVRIIDKELPSINIDPDLIKHVYTNLLSNAINYTSPGGKISVRVFRDGQRIISEITDGGIGIPKAEQGRIFEKFFRASNAVKKITNGTGLGLYLTKIIIESSGGRIWFESNEGKGSIFSFSLPIKRSENRVTKET